jgi:5'-phosphate synthase pdxT subunit
MLKLMEETGWEAAIRSFNERGGAVFGTCAGIILLARTVNGPRQRSLGLLDIDVERNGYGRQIDSFETDVVWTGTPRTSRGVFIRAPRIARVGDGVEVLARVGGNPVLVRQGRVLGATFHPELTEDLTIHRFFVEEAIREGAVA